MPIYAYKCDSCGHAQDALQKISDPPLTDCPACGQPTLRKQVTAAGFQLKGSGWYVTDFRGGDKAAPKPADAPAGGEAPKAAPADAASPAAATPAAAPAAPAPAASPAPAPSPSSST
jgi:putative FmdB family regulatory protein